MAGNAEELEKALKKASDAGRQDPDQADIAADDAGGTRLAEGLDDDEDDAGGTRLAEGLDDDEDESEAHPS